MLVCRNCVQLLPGYFIVGGRPGNAASNSLSYDPLPPRHQVVCNRRSFELDQCRSHDIDAIIIIRHGGAPLWLLGASLFREVHAPSRGCYLGNSQRTQLCARTTRINWGASFAAVREVTSSLLARRRLPAPKLTSPLDRARSISGALHGAAGRVADWKRARFEPADRALAHAVGAREIGLRSAFPKALDGLAPLVRGQDSGPPEFHTVGLGSLAAVAGASDDQVALELSQPTDDGEEQLAMRRRGIGPRLGR